MSTDMLGKIIDQGGMFAVLIVGLWFFSRIGWWVFKRLLSPASVGQEPGILVNWFSAHQEFLDGLAHRDKQQVETCRQHVALMQCLATSSSARIKIVDGTANRINGLFAATEPLNHTIIDLTQVRLLELSVHPGMTEDEVAAVHKQVRSLLQAIRVRHEAALQALLAMKNVTPIPAS